MKVRALLVDETAFVRDALKRALRRFLTDVEIFDAINGHRAVAVLRANPINLIIGEWDMEEMSGLELLQYVRGEERSAKTPFIVMSDDGDRDAVMSAINAGANDILAKPFTPDDVQKKVLKQLARLGYKPKGAGASSQNSGFGSVDVYDGGAPLPMAEADTATAKSPSKAPNSTKPKPPSKAKPTNPFKHFKGSARIEFSDYSVSCSINELSRAGIVGSVERSEQAQLPHIFELGRADISNSHGLVIGSVDIYVFAMQAAEADPDATSVSVKLRFTDNASQDIEALAAAVAKS